MIAHNGKYKSAKSQPAHLLYDGETIVGSINELTVQNVTDDSISLTWKYESDADGFNVKVQALRPYPNLAPRTTKTKNITLKLAPGAFYQFEVINEIKNIFRIYYRIFYSFKVYAYKKNLVGPVAIISSRTPGAVLPVINDVQAVLGDEPGTVKLSWEKPNYVKKLNWLYGVYYGIKKEELFESKSFST